MERRKFLAASTAAGGVAATLPAPALAQAVALSQCASPDAPPQS